MIIHFNYANNTFKDKQTENTKSIKKYIKNINSINFSPKDIDKNFREENDKILKQKKGNGLWLWKPYFLKKVYEEAKEDDLIIYSDSGLLFQRRINELILEIQKRKLDYYFFDLPLLEKQWTKRKVIEYFLKDQEFDLNFKNQVSANLFVIRKNKSTQALIDNYLEYSKVEEFIDDREENEKEYFIEHRHDQSILSMILHRKNIKKYRDQTDYGKFPLRYLEKGRAIYITSQEFLIDNGKPIALSFKRESAIRYQIKYKIRSTISQILKNPKNLQEI